MERATDDRDIVSAVRDALVGKVGQQKFDLWFADADFALAEGALIVESADEFKQEVLRANFAAEILSVAKSIAGTTAPLQYRLRRTPRPAPPRCQSAGERASPCKPVPPHAPAPPRHPGARAGGDFACYAVGDSNRMAHATAQAIAAGEIACSSLMLYGPTGVGKTHLLEAIAAASRRADARRRVLMLSAEQFTTMFVEAVRGSGLPSFRRKHRGVDLLILDDLQFFAGKRATLVELLYTIDTLLAEGRQLVFAADRPLADLKALGSELVTRLAGGMICRVQPPEYETRLEIARQVSQRLGIHVPEEALSLVARRISATAREISGAMFRLQAVARITGRAITRELADEALADLFADCGRPIRLADIHEAVCDVFHLEPDALQGGGKAKHMVHPRMLAMWLAKKHTRSALAEIGRYFGNRTHTTVLSAHKTVERWLKNAEQLAVADGTWQVSQAVRRLEERLNVG